jgi:agmatinase
MNPSDILPASVFLDLPPEHADPATAGVVLLPVPFERTSTFGRGSAAGPAAIIAASHELELFDAVLGTEPWRSAGGIATLPALSPAGDGAAVAARLQGEVASWLARGRFLVTLGGEHTSVVGAIRAHIAAHPDLTILQLDAHSDLRPDYQDDSWNHACAMARILDVHSRLVQVGIRSQDGSERTTSRERGLSVFYAHEILAADSAGEDWIGNVMAACGPDVYLTLDCDVFDPAVLPATGTPEPGGLTWFQVDSLLARLCRERNLAGFDVSELAPLAGLHHPEFTIAKLIYRLIGRRFGTSA